MKKNGKKSSTNLPAFLLTLADEVIAIAKGARPTSARQLVAQRIGAANIVAFDAGYEHGNEAGQAGCGGPDCPGCLLASHIHHAELEPMFLKHGTIEFDEASLFYWSAMAHNDRAFSFDQLQAALGGLVEQGIILWDEDTGTVSLSTKTIARLEEQKAKQAQTPPSPENSTGTAAAAD